MGTGGAENRRDRIRRKQEVTGGGERRKTRRRRAMSPNQLLKKSRQI